MAPLPGSVRGHHTAHNKKIRRSLDLSFFPPIACCRRHHHQKRLSDLRTQGNPHGISRRKETAHKYIILKIPTDMIYILKSVHALNTSHDIRIYHF